MERWRSDRIGPVFLKILGRVLYRLIDIEAFEVASLKGSFVEQRNQVAPMASTNSELMKALDEAIVTVAMKRLDDVWDQLFPAEQMRIVRLLVRQVNVSPNNMSMDLHPTGIQRLVLELHHKKLQPEPATELEAEAMA